MACGIPLPDEGWNPSYGGAGRLPLLVISADGPPLLGGGRLPAAADLPPLVVGADGPLTAPRGGALADGSLPEQLSARRWRRRPPPS
jgi:hypothetical protein